MYKRYLNTNINYQSYQFIHFPIKDFTISHHSYPIPNSILITPKNRHSKKKPKICAVDPKGIETKLSI